MTISYKTLELAFEYMSEIAISQAESALKKHRQTQTLAQIFRAKVARQEKPMEMNQEMIREFIRDYDEIEFGELMECVSEVEEFTERD